MTTRWLYQLFICSNFWPCIDWNGLNSVKEKLFKTSRNTWLFDICGDGGKCSKNSKDKSSKTKRCKSSKNKWRQMVYYRTCLTYVTCMKGRYYTCKWVDKCKRIENGFLKFLLHVFFSSLIRNSFKTFTNYLPKKLSVLNYVCAT